MFANAFAEDGVYQLAGKGGRCSDTKRWSIQAAHIRNIVADRVRKAQNTDPKTLSYDPASLRRFNALL